jgi:hypothetical protein
MITCKLQGGLGNQMFQIATTYATSKENNVGYDFDFNHCFTPNQGNPTKKYEDNFFKLINNTLDIRTIGNLTRYNEPKFSYSDISESPSLYLEGFFQTERYFKKYSEEVKNLFHFSDEQKEKIQKHIDSIGLPLTAIHVRRGDYLKHPNFHPTCSVEYYKNAMDAIDIIGDGNFIFISDDIEWCKENFKGENIYFSPFKNEIDDLLLISMCHNQIISNSSFSWWGAWMTNNNGIKIAPQKWFGDRGPKDVEDIIPDNWVKI